VVLAVAVAVVVVAVVVVVADGWWEEERWRMDGWMGEMILRWVGGW
jgi:hypothetical protein